LVIGMAAGSTFLLYSKKPRTRKVHPKPPVPLVTATQIDPGNEPVLIEASGNVIPAGKVELLAEVEGRITAQNPELVPGGLLGKGDFVVQIDRRDYTLGVEERAAEVVEAESDLELEKGQQTIANREWQLFEKENDLPEVNRQLVLREPHLKNAKAKLEGARARLAAAGLAEERTTLRSPFNALVLEEFVEEGQLLGRQSRIATLVDTDRFWVRVPVSLSALEGITFPGEPGIRGSRVRIILQTDNGSPLVRQGRVFKLLGDLEPKGRMARVLVSIDDPLDIQGNKGGKILLGSYVRVEIEAGVMRGVRVIPRQAVRPNDTLWILTTEGRLAIRPARVKWRRKDDLLVQADLEPGERVILSRLQSPLPGMALRVETEEAGAAPAKKTGPTGASAR